MCGVNADLEEIGQTPVGAAEQTASGDLPGMVGVVGGLTESERRRARMAVHTLRHEHVPVGAGRRDRVRIAGYIGAIPGDGHVPVSVGRDPWEDVRPAGL